MRGTELAIDVIIKGIGVMLVGVVVFLILDKLFLGLGFVEKICEVYPPICGRSGMPETAEYITAKVSTVALVKAIQCVADIKNCEPEFFTPSGKVFGEKDIRSQEYENLITGGVIMGRKETEKVTLSECTSETSPLKCEKLCKEKYCKGKGFCECKCKGNKCEVSYVLLGSVVKCERDESGEEVKVCTVKNFYLPQHITKADVWIKGHGDPKFLVYWQSFPPGVDKAWLEKFGAVEEAFDVVMGWWVVGKAFKIGKKYLVYGGKKLIGRITKKELEQTAKTVFTEEIKSSFTREEAKKIAKRFGAIGTAGALLGLLQSRAIKFEPYPFSIVLKIPYEDPEPFYLQTDKIVVSKDTKTTGYFVSPCKADIQVERGVVECEKYIYDMDKKTLLCNISRIDKSSEIEKEEFFCPTDVNRLFERDMSYWINYYNPDNELKRMIEKYTRKIKSFTKDQLKIIEKTNNGVEFTDPLTGFSFKFTGDKNKKLSEISFKDSNGKTVSLSVDGEGNIQCPGLENTQMRRFKEKEGVYLVEFNVPMKVSIEYRWMNKCTGEWKKAERLSPEEDFCENSKPDESYVCCFRFVADEKCMEFLRKSSEIKYFAGYQTYYVYSGSLKMDKETVEDLLNSKERGMVTEIFVKYDDDFWVYYTDMDEDGYADTIGVGYKNIGENWINKIKEKLKDAAKDIRFVLINNDDDPGFDIIVSKDCKVHAVVLNSEILSPEEGEHNFCYPRGCTLERAADWAPVVLGGIGSVVGAFFGGIGAVPMGELGFMVGQGVRTFFFVENTILGGETCKWPGEKG